MNYTLGVSMILAFCLSQAFRDVYLGHIFQKVDFFAVILLAFIPSTLVFGAIAWFFRRDQLFALRKHVPAVIAMNFATATAWTSYFFGLAHLEPAIVNTIHSGIAPLTVLALTAIGLAIAGNHRAGRLEGWLLTGMTLTLIGLAWLVLSGRSGLAGSGRAEAGAASPFVALCLLVVSGVSITISHLIAKHLSGTGAGAAAITASRYLLIMVLAAGFLVVRDTPSGVTGIGQGLWLGVAAALLVAVPLYALQIGIAHTPQLMAHILRALGPVFVFALQQFDGRLHWSTPVLILIVLYSIFVAGANIAHGRSMQVNR